MDGVFIFPSESDPGKFVTFFKTLIGLDRLRYVNIMMTLFLFCHRLRANSSILIYKKNPKTQNKHLTLLLILKSAIGLLQGFKSI